MPTDNTTYDCPCGWSGGDDDLSSNDYIDRNQIAPGEIVPSGRCPKCSQFIYEAEDTQSESWRAQRFVELMREWFWQEAGAENEVGGADTVDFATETLVNLGFGPPPHPDNALGDAVGALASDWCDGNDCESPDCHRCHPRAGCEAHDKCREESGEGEELVGGDYHVMWEIDLYARTAREAAELALKTHRDPLSIAMVFDVTRDGDGEPTRVDLNEPESV